MADVRIKVGASLDSDISNVFRPLIDAAKRARTTISNDAKRASADETKIAVAAAKEQSKASIAAARDAARETARSNREVIRASSRMESDASKAMADQAKERIRAESRLKLEAIRVTSRAEIEAAKQAGRERQRMVGGGGGGGGGGFGSGFGGVRDYMASHRLVHAGGRGFTSSIGVGRGIAASIARGAGIDLNFSSAVGRNVARQAAVVDLVNSGYIPGASGANGKKQNAGELDTEVRGIANANAMSPNKVVEGLQGFTSVTGDLETGRKVMGDLAMLARATGSSIEDIADAAGNVSAQLGEAPDKAETLQRIMKAIAGQGKLGAVEIKDMAVQMAALAAVAPQFKGSKADNIVMMGVLAQEARAHGGAKNAAQATTAVGSFVNTFSKNARFTQFAKLGIDPTKSSPQEIILQSLSKTGGNDLKMGKLFADTNAKRAVRGFQSIYNETHGDDKTKIAAVVAEFDRLKAAAMAQGQVEKDAADALQTTAAKAQIFQNKLDDTALELQTKLLPALESMQEPILKLVSSLGNMVAWAASNPGLAITGAIVASIGKAAIGEVVARALAGAIGGGGGGFGGGGGGKGGGVLGAIGIGGAIGTGVAAYITEEGVSGWNKNKGRLGAITSRLANMSPEEKKRALPEAIREYTKLSEERSALDKTTGTSDAEFAGAGEYLRGQAEQLGMMSKQTEHAEKTNALLGGVLKVEIVNLPSPLSAQPPPLTSNGTYNPVQQPLMLPPGDIKF